MFLNNICHAWLHTNDLTGYNQLNQHFICDLVCHLFSHSCFIKHIEIILDVSKARKLEADEVNDTKAALLDHDNNTCIQVYMNGQNDRYLD